ncbi:hypothetical protein D4764_15G0012580, partial [Takifugu flavidus]
MFHRTQTAPSLCHLTGRPEFRGEQNHSGDSISEDTDEMMGFRPRASILMYQLQLTTSQVGLQDISEHQGAAGSLSASSLPPSQTWVLGSTDVLSQAGQRDTWPNHRNTSSCRLPDVHHREKPGQRSYCSAILCSALWNT